MDSRRIFVAVWVALANVPPAWASPESALRFTDVSAAAGVAVEHGAVPEDLDTVATGVAAGDVDDDGWIDLYVIGGSTTQQHLFRNRGDGTFSAVPAAGGAELAGENVWGPSLADVDGDGDLDLFVGGPDRAGPALFRNDGGGAFVEIGRAGAMFPRGTYVSASFADYDRDGDLDLLTTHWFLLRARGDVAHLWRNDGSGRFVAVPESESGLVIKVERTDFGEVAWTFTGNFADIDGDGLEDLLLASDFLTSQVFRNLGGGRFADVTSAVIDDENGMGAAVGDYDNDGDLDWFVTSIYDASGVPTDRWGSSGNRLYRNLGDGRFEDATGEAGVREGYWGWGACFADFDNDGDLDLYHVNGNREAPELWLDKPALLFLNRGDGTFAEMAAAAGVDDRGNGRGVACFDYDRDGDVDIFVSNADGPTRLFRNELSGDDAFLQVELVGRAPNTQGIGARVAVVANGVRRIRHIHSGNNYGSQSPAVAHFGLGTADNAEQLEVTWPGGERSIIHGLPVRREVLVFELGGDANQDQATTAADLVFTMRARAAGRPEGLRGPRWDLTFDDKVDEADLNLVRDWIFSGAMRHVVR